MKPRLIILVFTTITYITTQASTLPTFTTARISGIGGYNASIYDNDINLATHNPSLLNHTMNHQLALNYTNQIADINYGNITYARAIDSSNIVSASIDYQHYGTFIETDEVGNKIGTFTAANYTLSLTWAKPLNPYIQLGVRIKTHYSILEKYNSFGIASDFGITYHNSHNLLSAGITFNNVGTQLINYDSDEKPQAYQPQITIGITKALHNAPFRFTLTYRHLEKFNNIYINQSTQTNNDITNIGKFISHLIIATEIFFKQNLYFSLAYNFQRQQELAVDSRPSVVGLSAGTGIRIKKVNFNYSYTQYHLAGNTHSIAISTTLPSK